MRDWIHTNDHSRKEKIMKNSVVIIVPYFGKLPNYFNLWMESVKYNSKIDVMFFTDIKKPNSIPENIIWTKMSFNEVQKRASATIGFQVSLSMPYKLTDYKPVYGEMFGDFIKNYDWWGFGDIDTIWGDLSPIINEKHLTSFDKILELGHLTLIKNTNNMNHLYKKHVNHAWNYTEAFKTNFSYHFDEGGGFSFIARQNGCRIYSQYPKNMSFADIDPNKEAFHLAYNINKFSYVFIWKKGTLKGFWIDNHKIQSRDFTYIHLQKRSMEVLVDDYSRGFIIIPNKFLPIKGNFVNKDFIINASRLAPKIEEKRISKLSRLKEKTLIIQRINKIPVNGNEVYFDTELPKY